VRDVESAIDEDACSDGEAKEDTAGSPVSADGERGLSALLGVVEANAMPVDVGCVSRAEGGDNGPLGP